MSTYIIDEERVLVDFLNLQELLEHSDPPMTVKLVTGCPLCDMIYYCDKAYESTYPEKPGIVMDGDEYGLYIPCEDDYYSGVKMHINFCPKCGRRLVK